MKIESYSLYLPSESDMKELTLPASLKRRAPRIWKLAYAAVQEVMEKSGVTPEAIVCGTALGALDETISFIKKVNTSNMGSPRQFIASVHNSMAGVMAKEFTITGSNMTLCESHNSLASAISTAKYLPEQKVFILIVDEQLPFLDEIYEQCENSESFTGAVQEGSLALIIDKESDEFPQISATAPTPSAEVKQRGSLFSPAIELNELLNSKKSGKIETYSSTSHCGSSVSVLYE